MLHWALWLRSLFGFRWRRRRPPGAGSDPYAWRPVPLRPRPGGRSAAVAVAEPED